jgi:hypothetical protein
MKGFDRGRDLRVSGPGRLDEAEPFPCDIDLALPAKGAFNRADNLHAGGQPTVNQRPGDATGNGPFGGCGHYLDILLHRVSVRAGRH